jgi:hypothetical protein
MSSIVTSMRLLIRHRGRPGTNHRCRASFVYVKHHSDRIRAFIKYFNKTMAKPFKWTYRGRR